jgi:hypothetical protein
MDLRIKREDDKEKLINKNSLISATGPISANFFHISSRATKT